MAGWASVTGKRTEHGYDESGPDGRAGHRPV